MTDDDRFFRILKDISSNEDRVSEISKPGNPYGFKRNTDTCDSFKPNHESIPPDFRFGPLNGTPLRSWRIRFIAEMHPTADPNMLIMKLRLPNPRMRISRRKTAHRSKARKLK